MDINHLTIALGRPECRFQFDLTAFERSLMRAKQRRLRLREFRSIITGKGRLFARRLFAAAKAGASGQAR